MGIFHWFESLIAGKQESYSEYRNKAQTDASLLKEDESTKYGLDFTQVIEAHQRWKKRLDDFINNRSKETLNHRDVCCDDKCVLGIWIYSSGEDAFQHNPIYEQMKRTHTQFHVMAGEVVKLKETGNPKLAKELLESSMYLQLSVKLQSLLAKLYLHD